MAKKKKAKETDTGTLGRLSKVGEDAFTRLVDELAKNERVTDALSKATVREGKGGRGREARARPGRRRRRRRAEGPPHPHRAAREASGQARGGRQAGAEAKTDGQAQDVDEPRGPRLRRRRSRRLPTATRPPPTPLNSGRAGAAPAGRPRRSPASFPAARRPARSGAARPRGPRRALRGRPRPEGAGGTCLDRSSAA